MESGISIRQATPSDAEGIRGIYSHYVTDTAVSFEFEVPSEEEFRRRIVNTLKKYPYLVAESKGKIVGYAYASEFKGRPAYAPSVETTVYIDPEYQRKGIGRAFYENLERMLRWQNVRLMCACIAYNEEEDEHLNHDSIRFHESIGFSEVGRFESCAYKFGRWYGIVWMTKSIFSDRNPPKEFVPLSSMMDRI